MVVPLRGKVGGVVVRGLGCLVVLLGAIGTGNARGQSLVSDGTLDQLLRMSPGDLEALYQRGVVAAIPPGRGPEGRPCSRPGHGDCSFSPGALGSFGRGRSSSRDRARRSTVSSGYG